MTEINQKPLPAVARFFFYGLHGLFDEIVFTALFDLFLHPHGNAHLKGYSTIYSFFIYGTYVCVPVSETWHQDAH